MWFGWFYLLSLRAALLPLLPGGPARHCVPRPSAAWHSLPDTMQQPPLHACASELRAAAGQGPRGPGLQRPSPSPVTISIPSSQRRRSRRALAYSSPLLVPPFSSSQPLHHGGD